MAKPTAVPRSSLREQSAAVWREMKACTLDKERLRLKRKLFSMNAGLVPKFVRKYTCNTRVLFDPDDIEQAASMGLFESLERWNPELGALSTWAAWEVRKRIDGALEKADPIHLKDRGFTYKQTRTLDRIYSAEGRVATADELGIPEDEYKRRQEERHFFLVEADCIGGLDHEQDGNSKLRGRPVEIVDKEKISIEEQLDLARRRSRPIPNKVVDFTSLRSLRMIVHKLQTEGRGALMDQLTPREKWQALCKFPPRAVLLKLWDLYEAAIEKEPLDSPLILDKIRDEGRSELLMHLTSSERRQLLRRCPSARLLSKLWELYEADVEIEFVEGQTRRAGG